ncbi:AAA family ATPase [Vibrio toranzoniae]|uniref:AAA family ATPase n=1 Tax=Vibrio toranzoniae TaxID=1194427 RepID=UPI0013782397|nr:AAA family ATPase [Vibrio toranzoniae]NAZ94383.1 AAA family ATPase [Vibrio toranzoniae]
MINNYYDNNQSKTYNLINKSYSSNSDDNVYSAIIGKNGTGKSQLLRQITLKLIGDKCKLSTLERYQSDVRLLDFNHKDSILNTSSMPVQVIASSTSPFDKFPLRKSTDDTYSYLGLRGLNSRDLGQSYMAKIIVELLQSIWSNPERSITIGNILSYLGYSDEIEVILHVPHYLKRGFADFDFSSKNAGSLIEKLMSVGGDRYLNHTFLYDCDENLNEDVALKCSEFLKMVTMSNFSKFFKVKIDSSGIYFDDSGLFSHYGLGSVDIILLMSLGMLSMRRLNLKKLNLDEHFAIGNASSGEQSIVIGFLGIASKIKDNSLILIDEPEVCLHPEWQERYIELLMKTFADYKGCHFIVATHSPQIISNLSGKNCFVMNMEDGLSHNADEFANRSADFQLAYLFRSPGHNNEYLSRIALNTFVKVSKNKRFDDDDLVHTKVLLDILPLLDREQALSELISTIVKLEEMYGRD